MSAVIEDKPGIIDSDCEVKKLQELVRKLEKQNQALRSKQSDREKDSGTDLSAVSKTVNNGRIVKTNNLVKSDITHAQVKNVVVDDISLLDLENKSDAELEDDEWLFQSPTKPSSPNHVSPYKWMRQEFEHPSPELEGVRRSLIHKLDQVARVPHSISAGNLSSIASLQAFQSPNQKNLERDSSPSSRRSSSPHGSSKSLPNHKPSIRQPLTTNKFDSSTFKKTKKKVLNNPAKDRVDGCDSGNSSDEPVTFIPNHLQVNSLPAPQPRVSPPVGDGDEVGTDVLKDVEDVQEVARLQEESLRQSRNSPYLAKKTIKYRSNSQEGLLDQPETGLRTGTFTRKSPAQNGRKGMLGSGDKEAVQRSNASLESVGSSNSSGAASSPYGSNSRLDQPHLTSNSSENHRRSLPNLARAGLSLPQQPRSHEEPSPKSSLNKTSRLTPPHTSALQRQQSPARTQSPNRSGLPVPRASGIPRPGSASKLPTIRKSGIPSSLRRTVTAPRSVDESWKEGCY